MEWTETSFPVCPCRHSSLHLAWNRKSGANAIRVRRVVIVGIAIAVGISEVRGVRDCAEPKVRPV